MSPPGISVTAACAARILHRFPVDFPQPRLPEMRREPAFHRIVDEIRDLFRETGVL